MSENYQGTLTVKVVRGQLFVKKILKCKPFIEIEFPNSIKTTSIKKGREPAWGDSFNFDRINEGFLLFRVFNKGYVKKSMKGRGLVPLKDCLQTGTDALECPAYRNSKKVAIIKFELNFIPSRPNQQELSSIELHPSFEPSYSQSILEEKKAIKRKESHPSTKNKPQNKFENERALDRVTYGLKISDIRWGKRIYHSENEEQSVYLAQIPPNNTEVVAKITYCNNPDKFNIVQKEAETMSALSHPNICKFYGSLLDMSFQKYNSVLILERCQGQDLAKEIHLREKERRNWSENELWELFGALLDAFAYIESNGIVHSDIKPANIIFNDEHPKVIDFGISLLSPLEFFTCTATYEVGGSLPFFSPAQMQAYLDFIKGKNPKGSVHHNPFKSDVFALGLTFYACAKLDLDNGMNDPRNPELQEFVFERVDGLNYSDRLKDLIKSMLIVDEKSRPNFCDVSGELDS